MNPIQCLDVLVDPSEEALPVDDPQVLLPAPGNFPGFPTIYPIAIGNADVTLIDDPSSNNNADGYGPRNPGRQVREGGSGVHLTRMQHDPLVARDDTAEATIGDGNQDVNVLANDDWTGVPTIVIVSGPTLSGATATIFGTGTGSRIRYTPPSSGDAGTDVIVYKLTASGSRDSAKAKLSVAVSASSAQPSGPYQLTIMLITDAPEAAFWLNIIGFGDITINGVTVNEIVTWDELEAYPIAGGIGYPSGTNILQVGGFFLASQVYALWSGGSGSSPTVTLTFATGEFGLIVTNVSAP